MIYLIIQFPSDYENSVIVGYCNSEDGAYDYIDSLEGGESWDYEVRELERIQPVESTDDEDV